MHPPTNVPHDADFFKQMKECRHNYRLLADAMNETLMASVSKKDRPSLLDIGCGTGCQSARLAEHGWAVTGVDVFDTDPEPGFYFLKRDLLEQPLKVPYDVVVCTETAEHIYEARADKLVEVVATHSLKRIVWSAAGPGQPWEGHVNLQEPEYWLKKFAARGVVLDEGATKMLRDTMLATRAQHFSVTQNFHILKHSQ